MQVIFESDEVRREPREQTTNLHDGAMSLSGSSPLGEDLGLLELKGVLALGELVHDVGDLLLQTKVVALVQLVEKRLAASSDGEIGERRRAARCSSAGSMSAPER